MNRRQFVNSMAICVTLLLFAGSFAKVVVAADKLSGRWQAEVSSSEGSAVTLTFEFKANGDVLTGTVNSPSQGKTFEIKDGKIKGNSISFTGEFIGITSWTGTLNGDELSLICKFSDGMAQNMKAHRK